MKRKTQRLGIYLPFLFISLAVVTLLRCIACLSDFNFTTGYFDNKTIITIADLLTVGCCVFAFTYAFSKKNNSCDLIPSFSSPGTYVPTGMVVCSIVFFAVDLLSTLDIAAIKTLGFAGAPDEFIKPMIALLAVFATVHFVLTALVTGAGSTARAALGLCAALFLATYAVYLYFNTEMPLNAPNKVVDQMAFLFSSIFILYETRISIGRERWGAYIAFGMIAAILAAFSSVPSLVVYFAKGKLISNSVYESVFAFCLFVFISCRLVIAAYLKEDKESEFITILKKEYAERNEYIAGVEDKAKIAYIEYMKEKEAAARAAAEAEHEAAQAEANAEAEIAASEAETPMDPTENEIAAESRECNNAEATESAEEYAGNSQTGGAEQTVDADSEEAEPEQQALTIEPAEPSGAESEQKNNSEEIQDTLPTEKNDQPSEGSAE